MFLEDLLLRAAYRICLWLDGPDDDDDDDDCEDDDGGLGRVI
jgi:hypothetical protein